MLGLGGGVLNSRFVVLLNRAMIGDNLWREC